MSHGSNMTTRLSGGDTYVVSPDKRSWVYSDPNIPNAGDVRRISVHVHGFVVTHAALHFR